MKQQKKADTGRELIGVRLTANTEDTMPYRALVATFRDTKKLGLIEVYSLGEDKLQEMYLSDDDGATVRKEITDEALKAEVKAALRDVAMFAAVQI